MDLLERVLRFAWPVVDILIRFWAAKLVLVSGMLSLMHERADLDLSAGFYPVAAQATAYVELAGAALLAIGLTTRYAAWLLVILMIVIQVSNNSIDNQLAWLLLFGWYAICGAGPISLDNLLRRGLADSALPFLPRLIRISKWVRVNVGPYYLSILRIWLGFALIDATSRAGTLVAAQVPTIAWWLSLGLESNSALGGFLAGGIMLVLGFATRLVSATLLLFLLANIMMAAHQIDVVGVSILFSLLIGHGAGPISLDRLTLAFLVSRFPRLDRHDPMTAQAGPRVVIVGAGFGGMSCANAFRKTNIAVTLIDQANYHLFQPLLYQVATAGLSPGDVAAPIRSVFRDELGIRVMLGRVTGIDVQKASVLIGRKNIPFDYLVLATGATHSYFGKDDWASCAPGLKQIDDAIEIRRKILTAFEHAEVTESDDERAALLTFLIVGGGPTGVELAGAIAELARYGMDKEFRAFDPAHARVILVQAAPRLLPAFPESLAAIATRSLKKLGIEVLLDSRVENIDERGVSVGGIRIAARTVIWAAGVTASPAATWLRAGADSSGRIQVTEDLSVPGMPNIFAIGDTAASNSWKGRGVPGLAPAAKQGGIYVARVIKAKIGARPAPASFAYRHLGSLATIGRKAAVADFGFVKLWGAPAWWLWGIVHVGFLVGMRNRAATMMNWFWAYLTFGGGIRLITTAKAQSSLSDSPVQREPLQSGTLRSHVL